MSTPSTDTGPTGAARRPTRQRAALAELMATTSQFLSAQELHSRLQARGASVGLATVYRTLQLYAEHGLLDSLRREDGEAIYRRCSDTHHHHLVCRGCGATVEVDGRLFKEYYGSASDFNKGEYKHVEGKRILEPVKGRLADTLKEMQEDLQSSISYAGGTKLADVRKVNYVILGGDNAGEHLLM